MCSPLCRSGRQISIHALREEGDTAAAAAAGLDHISIHALREEGDAPGGGNHAQHEDFYPRPPRGGRHNEAVLMDAVFIISIHALREEGDDVIKGLLAMSGKISIHALREEGDSKNGEKHLRFCFIIKRSAQIWKSFSKNIRKNSCDLHRTA